MTVLKLSSTSRKIGAIHLAVAAVVNAVVGANVLLVVGNSAEHTALWYLGQFLDQSILLNAGPSLLTTVVTAVRFTAVVLLVLALTQLIAARYTYTGTKRTLGLTAGTAGILTLVTLPWAAIGTVLLYLTRDQFRDDVAS